MSAALKFPSVLGPVSGDGIARLYALGHATRPTVNLWEWVADG